MDPHAASCTLAVISEKGRKLRDFPVEANGRALAHVDVVEGTKDLPISLPTSDPACVQTGLTYYLRDDRSAVDEASRFESAPSPLTHTGLDQPR